MRWLALDSATRVGWCVGPEQIKFGAYQLPKDSGNAPRFIHFKKFILGVIQRERVGALVVEAPLPRKSIAQTKLAFGFYCQAQIAAFQCGIGFHDAPNNSVKKWWTGDGRAKKEQMIGECRRRGFDVDDDNAADAIAILHYATAIWGR